VLSWKNLCNRCINTPLLEYKYCWVLLGDPLPASHMAPGDRLRLTPVTYVFYYMKSRPSFRRDRVTSLQRARPGLQPVVSQYLQHFHYTNFFLLPCFFYNEYIFHLYPLYKFPFCHHVTECRHVQS
jgi:hypothetical protein